MKHRVRILRRAVTDLTEIQAYLEREAPAAAVRVVEGLLVAIERLADAAEKAPLVRDDRLRRIGYRALARGRYLVFYRIIGSTVRVYRVLHQRRAYDRVV
jgi:plasmid stabilization system protein ParE